jgi:glycerol-3-phosphate acyltransferase PlsY
MENLIQFIILISFAYLCGSIPFGFLLAKSKKVNILKEGSGNVGATNILRTFGFPYFLLVAVLDVLKIIIPILLAQKIGMSDIQISIIILFAITGSMFSCWLKFKGGKAVSAIFGALLCLIGIYNFLLFLFIWILILYVTKIMSLTNILIVLIFPFMLYHTTNSVAYLILGIIFIPIIWLSHKENIKRLTKGKESKIIKF